MQNVLSQFSLDHVLVDIYGPLPSDWNNVSYIFVVLDNFSRFAKLYPMKRTTALATTNHMINHYISTYEKPKTIVSDHGVQFNSKIWQTRLSNLGIPPTFTSVYQPQSNPAERVMRELGRLFRLYNSEHHFDWPTYVQYIEWVLNNSVHEATGSTPSKIFLKQPRYNPLSVLLNFPPGIVFNAGQWLVMAQKIQHPRAEKQNRRYYQKGIPTSYKIGDLVLVRTHNLCSSVDKCIHKLFMLYEGTFVVKEIKNKNAYVVCDPKTNRVRGCFNIILLRLYLRPVTQ